jgi:putative spermidine/putrescine transport system substrate-binding protein
MRKLMVSRRRVLNSTIGGAAALIAAPAVISSARAQSRVIYINTWGGSWTAAEDAAFFKPFTKETGITVSPVTPVSYAKLKAQVQFGNYEWDITEPTDADWLRADQEGLAEKIDWTIVKQSNLFENAVYANGIKFCSLSTNICYRTDKLPNGGPRNWADFWDVKKFPGKRALYKNAVRVCIFALLADGVSKDQLFPLDLDRAFKKLDQIKPHITVWWTQGSQSQQLLRDGEVDMISIWNARASELKDQGVPIEIVWQDAPVYFTMWGVVKGAPHAREAWEFIQFAVQPERQAEFSRRLYYGPSNPATYEYLSPEVSRQLPTSPENVKATFTTNLEWEAANSAAVQERFTQWLAS